MQTTSSTDVRSVALAALQFSQTTSQIERRKYLDKGKLAELAASIKSHGLVQPILVRPSPFREVDEELFEVVAGERRVLAAREAGLEEIQATVRELDDEQVLELQLVENLQRQDLHELAEAEGYESLAKLGHTVDDMAAKVGKSRGTIYARMKLLALCKEARKAYYAGNLSASVALLLARIPNADLQKQALEEVLDDPDADWRAGDEKTPMSYRKAAEHIQDNYMLRLKEAPFPTGDEKLLTSAGACFSCPKNTASHLAQGNLELFSDIKDARAGVCTDPTCFKAKRAAWGEQAIAQAKVNGQKVITGPEAKKLTKNGTHSLADGYVKLDDHCHDDKKHRTYRELLGKAVTPALLQLPADRNDDDIGKVIEVVRKSDIAETLQKKGVGARQGSTANQNYREQQKAFDKKRKREIEFRLELFTQLRLMSRDELSLDELREVAHLAFEGIGYECQKQLLKVWGWTDKDDKQMDPYQMRGEKLTKELSAYSQAELLTFLLDCVFSKDLYVETYGTISKPAHLLAAAKRLKIDPEKLRKQLTHEEKAERVERTAPRKASKKKGAAGR
jgi:ParB/RepB/Spo0J family partition protein